MNLCVNARDAMPGGGKLTLAAGNLTIDKGLAYAQLKPGNYVVLEVIDTGTGIPAEIIERVFEPFFTTKEPGKGTGLGLSTVLGIVRSHGGLVKVRTAPGAGSDFEIYLPAVAADSEEDLDQEAVAPQGKGQRILVVDDEPAVRELIGEILRRNGYQVLSAADGAEAVSMFSEPKWRIDLVIADIMMPLMDGVTLVRRLCRLSPSLRIIASTGLDYSAAGTEGTDDNRRRELQRLGVSIFLSKPYRAKTLLNAVHEALSTGTGAKPPIELMLS
jgi:CheY-like chemotaxis protein